METVPRTELLVSVPVVNKGSTATTANQSERHGANYSTTDNPCLHGCEGDHLISLELGGADDVANLWPQPYLPKPGAHEKDKVENWLHTQVCSGKMPLTEAQKEIAEDWYKVYLAMPKDKQ